VLAVGDAALLRLIEALDAMTQLRTGPSARLLGLQDTGPEEFRYILQLVGGKAEKELPRLAPLLNGCDCAEGLYQDRSRRRG